MVDALLSTLDTCTKYEKLQNMNIAQR